MLLYTYAKIRRAEKGQFKKNSLALPRVVYFNGISFRNNYVSCARNHYACHFYFRAGNEFKNQYAV